MANNEKISPENIMQLGSAFWASRTLLAAVELGVFTELAKGPRSLKDLEKKVGIHERSSRDFFDCLVALKMLERRDGKYSNTPSTDVFLDRNKPSYVGGLLEMMATRNWKPWGNLTAALRSGRAQSEMADAEDGFAALYADEKRLRTFLSAMTGVSLGAAKAMAEKFPWRNYKTFLDVGAAEGAVPVQLALAHPHLTGGSFDLKQVKPVYEDYVRSFKLESRLKFHAGSFFTDEIPTADVMVLGHILHDWGTKDKMMILKKVYQSLPKGGAVIVYEALIDDDRSTNAFGLLMSLNMLVETPEGFDYSGKDCIGWMKEVGFTDMKVEHLVGPDSMVIGFKR